MIDEALALVDDVPQQGRGALRVEANGTPVGLYRVGEEIVAWRDMCPHGAAPVCRGIVAGTRMPSQVYEYAYGRDREILQCPWHGWEFDLRSGNHLAEGSTARLRRHPVVVREGRIYDDSPSAHRVDIAVRVQERRALTDRVVLLRLSREDGADFPAWLPGTHISIELASGVVRQYSLCGDPRVRSTFDIAVLREADGRGGSIEMHELEAGSALHVTGIRNRFRLAPHPAYVFIAGGIGITALRPMIAAARRRGASVTVYYVGRDADDMAFAKELKYTGAHLIETRLQGRPSIQTLIGAAPAGAGVYVCGPPAMQDSAKEIGRQQSCDVTVAVESFRPAPERPTSALPRPQAFRAVLQRTGASIDVDAATSLLDALRSAGVSVGSSCEEGWCGSCETEVLDGIPEHRDRVLSDDERAEGLSMMICVSRSHTAVLTLDI